MGPATIASSGCRLDRRRVMSAPPRACSSRVVTGICYILAIAIGCLLFCLTVAARVKRHGDGTALDLSGFSSSITTTAPRVATITRCSHLPPTRPGSSWHPFDPRSAPGLGSGTVAAIGRVVIRHPVGGYLAVTYTDWVQVRSFCSASSWSAFRSLFRTRAVGRHARGAAGVALRLRRAGWTGWSVVVPRAQLLRRHGPLLAHFAARDAAASQNGALLACVDTADASPSPGWDSRARSSTGSRIGAGSSRLRARRFPSA